MLLTKHWHLFFTNRFILIQENVSIHFLQVKPNHPVPHHQLTLLHHKFNHNVAVLTTLAITMP